MEPWGARSWCGATSEGTPGSPRMRVGLGRVDFWITPVSFGQAVPADLALLLGSGDVYVGPG